MMDGTQSIICRLLFLCIEWMHVTCNYYMYSYNMYACAQNLIWILYTVLWSHLGVDLPLAARHPPSSTSSSSSSSRRSNTYAGIVVYII